jgi:oligopeptide/dipeptide ABC transporter ATP-binding protein
MENKTVVLDVNDLRVHYHTPSGDVRACNGVSFKMYRGELLGMVGESGCGKTTTAMALLRLIQTPGRIVHGSARLDGTDILSLSEKELKRIRWRKMALIPQGAMNSLNPLMKIHEQIADAIITHEGRQDKAKLKERIISLLKSVGLPERAYSLYPHELSGGMKQRVCIAMAIALRPPFIVADEPTSALDVVVQRLIAQTLKEIKEKMGISMLIIGHDMGLMAQLVDRIAVMYAGNMVELAPVRSIFKEPLHPYTKLLIDSVPSIKEKKALKLNEGMTHDLRNPPPGCLFHTRCPNAKPECRVTVPKLREIKPGHFAACNSFGCEGGAQ